MRSDEGMGGRVYITNGHTLCARHAHARNTLEERWGRCKCVRKARWVCAHGALINQSINQSFYSISDTFSVIHT